MQSAVSDAVGSRGVVARAVVARGLWLRGEEPLDPASFPFEVVRCR